MEDYPVSQLKTAADCDALLSIVAENVTNLEWHKITLQRQKIQYASNQFVIESELAAKQTELATMDSSISNLPDGPLKEDFIKKRAAVMQRIVLLESRQTNYGDVAIFEKVMELESKVG